MKGKKLMKKLVEKIKWRNKLRKMDHWWYFLGGNEWSPFPPSFYYTHTEEEIKQKQDAYLGKLRAILADFEERHPEVKKRETVSEVQQIEVKNE